MNDEFVCSNCFSDAGICYFVDSHAVENICSFCGKVADESIAASLDIVAQYIDGCISQEYDDAANWLAYETREGGYLGKTWDTYDLLTEEISIDLPNDHSQKLLQALLIEIEDFAWCKINPYSLSDEQKTQYSWDRFCRVVKHERRFFFSDHGTKSPLDDTMFPGETLRRIFEYAETIGLFARLESGTSLFRARYQDASHPLVTAEELGPPPVNLATQPNRMSPPGIVMFYASDNYETALRETANNPSGFAVGRFETRKNVNILDLSLLPPIPSIFEEIPDTLEFYPRKLIGFLHHITWAISQPIARDKKAHVNYVPTQVVTEYIRSNSLENGRAVQGIRYQSAVHPEHFSYVLFATQDNISPMPETTSIFHEKENRWIEFVEKKDITVSNDDLNEWQEEVSDVGFSDDDF